MIPAWMIEQLKRQEQERQEAEERNRAQLEVPLPTRDPREEIEDALREYERKAPRVIEISIL